MAQTNVLTNVTIIWILLLTGANLAYVQAQVWTSWEPCSDRENCHRVRQLSCTIDGRITYGIGCADVGDPYFKILRTGCDVNIDCAGQWQSTQNESCIGDCYDGTSISHFSCSTNPTCTMRTHSRCYNDSTCTGHFNILTQTNCSQSCGGGTQTLNGTCTNLSEPPNEQSYNCPGTNGVLAMQYSIMSTCNSQACPTWSTWSQSSSCSASCGGGHQTFESFCTYMGSASDLCGNGGTRRNKTEPCNDHQCLTYSQWSQWTTCDSCSEVRTRYRNCTLSCTEAQKSQIETEDCLLSPSCSTASTTISHSMTSKQAESTKAFFEEPYFPAVIVVIAILIIILVIVIIMCLRCRKVDIGSSREVLNPGIELSAYKDPEELLTDRSNSHSFSFGQQSEAQNITPVYATPDKKRKNATKEPVFHDNNAFIAEESQYAEIEEERTKNKKKKNSQDKKKNSFKKDHSDSKAKSNNVNGISTEEAKKDEGNSVGYTSMHHIIDPAYSSMTSRSMSRHGSLASHMTLESNSISESGSDWDCSSEESLDYIENTTVKPNLYEDDPTNASRIDSIRQKGLRPSNQAGQTLTYSSIDPISKTTTKMSVKKSRKNKSRRGDFQRSTRTGGSSRSDPRLRASSRKPNYPIIKEEKSVQFNEQYETMTNNATIESPYENNADNDRTTVDAPTSTDPSSQRASPQVPFPDPPQVAGSGERSPMPIPRKSVRRVNVTVSKDSEYAAIDDEH
ncbi:unnamed protein product [Clavelina lepadiformis]|uniref:Uncharacterized protein n=1 Tax=Clavelina lepadiformis TaxID=159417 RepID=A0ABP0H2N5_CLALP